MPAATDQMAPDATAPAVAPDQDLTEHRHDGA